MSEKKTSTKVKKKTTILEKKKHTMTQHQLTETINNK